MKGYVCKVCGYISINGSVPQNCPVCGAPKSSFEEKADAINNPKDADNMTEIEKKHVPVIVVQRKCGLIEGCTDAHVKIGEIQHPTLPAHYIVHIDFYVDNEYAARVALTPDKLNPAAAMHFKNSEGRLSVIALCNLHGAWIKEIE